MCLKKMRRSERKEDGRRWTREDWRELREILREERKAGGAHDAWKPTVCWTVVLQSGLDRSGGAKEDGGGGKTMEAND